MVGIEIAMRLAWPAEPDGLLRFDITLEACMKSEHRRRMNPLLLSRECKLFIRTEQEIGND